MEREKWLGQGVERGIKEIQRYDRGQGREKEDPREKEVNADGSSGLILVQEAQRRAEILCKSFSITEEEEAWKPPRERLSAGSCSCFFLMLALFGPSPLHGSWVSCVMWGAQRGAQNWVGYKPRRVARNGMKGKESSPRGTQEGGKGDWGAHGGKHMWSFFSFVLFYIVLCLWLSNSFNDTLIYYDTYTFQNVWVSKF